MTLSCLLRSSLLCDLVVTSVKKLDQAEPVAEGIRHDSNFAPDGCSYIVLDNRARANCACEGLIDILHDNIEVDRGPVTFVCAAANACAKRAAFILQQKHRNRPSGQFRYTVTKIPLQAQTERIRVERERTLEVGYIYVDQDAHECTCPRD